MKVWVVEGEDGEYSQRYNWTEAVFSTEQAARNFVERMESVQGWPGESSASRYSAVEVEVWEDAPEKVIRWHINELHKRRQPVRKDRCYRVERWVPVGWKGDLKAVAETDGRDPEWVELDVVAESEEECLREFARILAEFEAG